MTACVLALLWTCLGARFDVQGIQIDRDEARVFFAQVNAGPAADVFVLNGSTLTAYSGATAQPFPSLALLEGTSGFDVVDVDGDGRSEIIGICGDRILQYVIPAEGPATAPKELFSLHTELSAPEKAPYPYVLAAPREGRMLLALPCQNAIELRTLDGSLVASYPIGPQAASKILYGAAFAAHTVDPPERGRPDAIEQFVRRWVEFVPELPDDLAHPSDVKSVTPQRHDPWAAVQAAGEEPGKWPWFPLMTSSPGGPRQVLFALMKPTYQETKIRIRDFKTGQPDSPDKDATISSERHYPGAALVLEEDLPDFNHDGFTDLVLWKSPLPGMSTDSLTRALTGGTWKADLTFHLFSPGKNRYDPVPVSSIGCFVPVTRFLRGNYYVAPIEHCVLRDLDGDGRTDFACSTAQNAYSVWLYTDKGFPEKPDYDRSFPGPIRDIEFRADLEGKGRTAIGLRTDKALYILRVME